MLVVAHALFVQFELGAKLHTQVRLLLKLLFQLRDLDLLFLLLAFRFGL